ncbi:MAG TPA: replicative DNA helicase [Opitutae bacterium]|nr:replicative DNA helicase [Opitutae bacterium]|tara:strand:- start:2249 stop:3724 length:1476 start_codon:yes stop_codon:yes gene_type:complete
MSAVSSPSKKSKDFPGHSGDSANKPVSSEKIEGQALPSNLDAEQGILAACIVDASGEVISNCIERALRPEDFYFTKHQLIYDALLDLYNETIEPDEIVLAEKLKSNGNLEQAGGQDGLTRLAGRIDTTAHSSFWLDIVKQKSLLRKCIYMAFEMIDGANQQPSNVEDFLANFEQRVCSLGDEQNLRASIPFREPIQHAMEQIQRMLSREETDGVLTGYTDLDGLTNGFKPGEMIVLAARPSVGKTSLAMNIVENIAFSPKYAESPRHALVFSLEMSATSLAMRLICGRARVNMNDLRKGFVPRGQAEKLHQTSKDFQQAPLWVDDTSGLSINQIRAKARRLKMRNKLDFVVVDYLQLISTDSRVLSRENQISEISRGLKAMAKELDVPVLVLSQLNRDSEKERRDPRLSDLRESGAIEQDADVVMLLGKQRKGEDVREMDYDGETEAPEEDFEPIVLILAKQRNGPTGKINLAFRRKFTRFESMQQDHRLN